jgi:KaiC/GvpD/RAD55 family RecA-like ATPase
VNGARAMMTFAEVMFREARAANVERPVFEVRALGINGHAGVLSGYFDSPDKLTKAATAVHGAEGVYVTPSPVSPALLARAANRLKQPGKKGTSTADADVARRLWLLVDVDAKRPAGISATDAEKAAAEGEAVALRAWLGAQGWPDPVVGDSGNGAHLMYRIDEPNDAASLELVKRVTAALVAKVNGAGVHVDEKVVNAARIWKCYGTIAAKGDSVPERPHRKAQIVALPDRLQVVTRAQLEALAALAPSPAAPSPRPTASPAKGGGLDVRAWLAEHGLDVGGERAHDGAGWIAELKSCPWSDAHADGAYVGQMASGAAFAGCQHASCSGKGWAELRAKHEPERPSRNAPPPHTDDDAPPPSKGNGVHAHDTPAMRPPLRDKDAPPLTAAEILRSAEFSAPQATYPTGFAKLDEHIDGGVKARQLTVVAGPTGAGKSGLGFEMGRRLARQLPIMYCSTELDPAESAARAAAPEINARPSEILSLVRSPEQAADAIEELPIYIVDLDGIEGPAAVPEIRRRALAVKLATGQTPAIVVDYLQGLCADTEDGKRMSVTRAAKELRRLARELDTPIIAISSVARLYYGPGARKTMDAEQDPRAWLAAAKESGDIEYAAAVFVYLDTSSSVGPTGEMYARLIVAKSRRGQPGFVGIRFHGPTGRFIESAAAIEAMSPARKAAEDEDRVLATLRQIGRGVAKDDLRTRCGIGAAVADKAILRVLEDGRVVIRKTQRMNASGAKRQVALLALPDWPAGGAT